MKMDLLIKKLEKFGLENFVEIFKFYLCRRTVNQLQIASFLQFDADQIAIITLPPDNFSKCDKLYELIQKKSQVKNFLEALNETGNEHILKFIKKTDFSKSSTSTNPNRSRGIWFDIPDPIDSFCGREDFLSQIHDQLKPRDDSETEVTVLSQVKIMSGLGGIGKTQTARKYISKQRKFYNNFIWIDAQSENSMRNSFFKLAEEIKINTKNSERKSRGIGEIIKEIYNKICDGGKSNLIVFDNAEDYSSCRQFFPFGLHPELTKPVILATSRNQEWISPTGKIRVLPLDKMTEDESLEFILKQLEIPESEIPEFREESKEFIELIGGLPLALQQAVAYIKQEKELKGFIGQSYKISDYVKEFKSNMKKFQSFSPVPAPDSSPTVFVTYNLTLLKFFDLVNGEEAIKILAHLSFLYADKIPPTFLHDLVPEIKDGEFSGGLKLLEKYSLIKMNAGEFCLSIHRQLQFVILQYLKECDDISKVVTNIVGKCRGVLGNIKLSQSSDIFLNLHQIVKNQFNLIPMTEKFLDFMSDFGEVLFRASRYSESLDLYKKVYIKQQELLGANDPKTVKTQNDIAVQLAYLGKLDESFALIKQVLKNQEDHPDLGPDHPDTISTKHNLADVLLEQEKYGESLELFQQVLAQRNKIHGENHPSTLKTQNMIALLHLNLGHLSEALTMFGNLGKKQVEILGPHHPDLLHTKHNEANVLYKMGKFEEASKIFNEVHEKQKETLGENHLDTIETLEWIGATAEQEGKFTEALDIFKKVYEIRKTNFGVDHPVTITIKHNMATVLKKHKKYEESSELFQQVLAQRIKILGENHPETLITQNQIALLHLSLGNFSTALTLFEHVEKKQAEILGSDHRDALLTKHNKAVVLYKMGKFEEASKILDEVHEKQKEILGANHFDTIETLGMIGMTLEREAKFTEALDIYKKVYEIRKTNFGQSHPLTIGTKQNVAIVLHQLEKYGESLEMFQQVLAQRIKIHGENHPETLKTQYYIAEVHSDLGDLSKALALFEHVEKKETEILGPDHPDVILTKFNKANALFEMGKFEEAFKIFKEVDEKAILGQPHLLTMTALSWITETLEQERKFKEALDKKMYEIGKINLDDNHLD